MPHDNHATLLKWRLPNPPDAFRQVPHNRRHDKLGVAGLAIITALLNQ